MNTFLQTKLADVEHELHATREQNLALQTKRSTAQEELAELASRFDAAESSKAELVTLVDEVRHAPAGVLQLLGSGLWGRTAGVLLTAIASVVRLQRRSGQTNGL